MYGEKSRTYPDLRLLYIWYFEIEKNYNGQ